MIQNGSTLLFIASTTEHGSLLGFSFRSTPEVMPGWKKKQNKTKNGKNKNHNSQKTPNKGWPLLITVYTFLFSLLLSHRCFEFYDRQEMNTAKKSSVTIGIVY